MGVIFDTYKLLNNAGLRPKLCDNGRALTVERNGDRYVMCKDEPPIDLALEKKKAAE